MNEFMQIMIGKHRNVYEANLKVAESKGYPREYKAWIAEYLPQLYRQKPVPGVSIDFIIREAIMGAPGHMERDNDPVAYKK